MQTEAANAVSREKRGVSAAPVHSAPAGQAGGRVPGEQVPQSHIPHRPAADHVTTGQGVRSFALTPCSAPAWSEKGWILFAESAAGNAAPSPGVGYLVLLMLDDVSTREESCGHFLIRQVATEMQARDGNRTVGSI